MPARFMIQTGAGEKGPFSTEQLQQFVDEGKLPLDYAVTEAESGLRMEVGDLCDPPTAVEAPEKPQPVERTAAPTPAARRVTEAPGERVVVNRPKAAPKRGQLGAGTGLASAKFSRTQSSQAPMIVLGILFLGFIGWALWYWDKNQGGFTPSAPIVGTWALDSDALVAHLQAKREEAATPEDAFANDFADAFAKSFAEELELEFEFDQQDSYLARAAGKVQDSGRYEFVDYEGPKSIVKMTSSRTGKTLRWDCRFERGRLYVYDGARLTGVYLRR